MNWKQGWINWKHGWMNGKQGLMNWKQGWINGNRDEYEMGKGTRMVKWETVMDG